MYISRLIDEDYVNYKLPSMFLGTSICRRKCKGCQNEHLKNKNYDKKDDLLLCARYTNNPITKALVIGGLEPFDTFNDTRAFYKIFRRFSKDPVVIYTGYDKDEIINEVDDLIHMGGKLIIKYGHYIEGHESHYDNILGINLASDNQYAEEYDYECSI